MTQATPQRTVNISVIERNDPALPPPKNVQVAYTYWSPNDGMARTAWTKCDLIQTSATNTLFVLDYPSTANGWTIDRTEPNPPGAPALETVSGPAKQSIMTIFPELTVPQIFNFFIIYKNTVTGQEVGIDPQEKNVPDIR